MAIVAAEITANARHIMGRHILNVIEKEGAESLYYTNTDSLVTNCPIDDLIPIGTGLGEFKLEAEGMGEIFGINEVDEFQSSDQTLSIQKFSRNVVYVL